MKNKLKIASIVSLMCMCALPMESYFTLENDTFLRKDDSDYTHGTRFDLIDTDTLFHYMIQQTMYAPPDLRNKHHIPGERPYAGMLIGGVGYEFLQNPDSPWTHYGELDFGVIGPAAGCKDTQTAIHKLLGCRKPQGWDDQLHNEIVLNAQWWTKYNWFISDYVAIVPFGGAAVGNIQDFVESGAQLKIGYNIGRPANNEILFSAPAPRGNWTWKKLSAYAYVGASERFYLYNHILEGSMFHNRDDDLSVDIERFVTEMRAGFVLKYDRFFATYYAVFRTDEYKHQEKSPDFGGIGVGWTW